MKRLPKFQIEQIASGLAKTSVATCSKQAPRVLHLAARIAKDMLSSAKGSGK